MTYDFYDLAKEQPDLTDVVDYLKRPILILEDIHNRIKKSSLNDKTDPNIIQINLDCDKIIHRYFPELIENYCNLSIDYRNTSIIKEERKHGQQVRYTAKDLLIKNIATLTEEVLLLEESYNESHSRHLLVQNRLVSELGIHDSLLEMEEESPHKVKLENKFDYQAFKKINEDAFFKKEIKGDLAVNTIKKDPPKAVIKKEEEIYSGGGISFIELFLMMSLITLLMLGVFTVYNDHSNSQKNYYSMELLEQLSYSIRTLYSSTNGYHNISEEQLIAANVVSPKFIDNNKLIAPYGNVHIKSGNLRFPNDSFTIIFEHIPEKSCVYMVSRSAPEFNRIEINSSVIDAPITPMAAVDNCKDDNLISFIQQK